MPQTRAQITGQAKEQQAQAFLQSQGLCLLARNVRFKCGELDLIMKDKDQVVFVEVRWRADGSFGGAAASIGLAKQRRVRAAAQLWLQQRYGSSWPACRFDVCALSNQTSDWIQNAF